MTTSTSPSRVEHIARAIPDPALLLIGFYGLALLAVALLGGTTFSTLGQNGSIEQSAKPMFATEHIRWIFDNALFVAPTLASQPWTRPGVLLVTLLVTEGNVPAIAPQDSCGFKAFGVEPMAIATSGGFRSKVRMWLRLPQAV